MSLTKSRAFFMVFSLYSASASSQRAFSKLCENMKMPSSTGVVSRLRRKVVLERPWNARWREEFQGIASFHFIGFSKFWGFRTIKHTPYRYCLSGTKSYHMVLLGYDFVGNSCLLFRASFPLIYLFGKRPRFDSFYSRSGQLSLDNSMNAHVYHCRVYTMR